MKKTSPATRYSRPLRVRLLLAGSLTFLFAAANAVELTLDDGLIRVKANGVSVQEILDALSEKSGLRLVQQAVIERKVNIQIEAQSLSEVLDTLLENGDSYQLFLPPADYVDDNGEGVPGTLWVFAEATGEHYAIEFLETVILRGRIGEKKQAIRDLRYVATPAAVEALSFALGDKDKRVRDAAMEALTAIGSDEALAALASIRSIDDPLERAEATVAIAASGGRSASAYLDAALQDDDPRVRMAATEALGDLDDDAGRHRIQAALKDPDPAVRERAVEILEDLDDEAMFRALFPQKFQ